MFLSLRRFEAIATRFTNRLAQLVGKALWRMFVPLTKWKIVSLGLVVVVASVFAALLHRQHAVFSQSDRSEEIAINKHVWDVWRTTVVKEANKELSRIRKISTSNSYQSPQTVEELLQAYDVIYERETIADPMSGGIDRLMEADQKYPRFEFLKMFLDRGVIIENAAEYRALLTFRINLLSAESMFLHAGAEEKIRWLSGLGLPVNSSWEAIKEVQIQDYLEFFYYEKQALQDPILARQMAEGIFMLGRAKDGTRFPMRTDTTYFQLSGRGDTDIGNMAWPAMGLSSEDIEAIHKHLEPFPFAEKLPKHVKIGFLGPDGKPAEAPRRGMAKMKIWDGFADIFDDDDPEIARSELEATFPSQAEMQPVNASEPKPVYRTLPWSTEAEPSKDDSMPRTIPHHAVPELEMPEFPADLEQPEPASVIPSEIENQMKQVEDWQLPGGVTEEELEGLLESLEDIDDPTSIPNAADNPEILREDERYKDRGDPNGNRDESYEEQDESEKERREPPEMEP